MNNIYLQMGLPRVVNASGRMTYLGVSTLSEGVLKDMISAASSYVVMDDLLDIVGKQISKITTAEDTCVTASASSGIVLAVAGLIAGDNLALIERLPNSYGLNNQIIIPKGHVVNYGAPVSTMIALAGGELIEAGQSNSVKKEHIISSINSETCGLFYVKSHHSVQKGMISLEDMIAIAQEYTIPLIVDAAAEEDLTKYIKMGVDLVIYSGAKAICGPTSGFITGRADLIKLCKAQYKGIGRAMKVGKETLVGIGRAVHEYVAYDHTNTGKMQYEAVLFMAEALKNIGNLKISVEQDEAGRSIYRLKITIIGGNKEALAIVHELKQGEISIHVRDHYANIGVLYVDPRGLVDGDKELIVNKIREIMA